MGLDTRFITVSRNGVVTNYSTKWYTLIGNNIVTLDEHCRVVATLY